MPHGALSSKIPTFMSFLPGNDVETLLNINLSIAILSTR